MEPILLNDLLQISASEIDNYKIRFMQFNGEVNPMDEYLREPELINTQWLLWRTKQRYFSVGQIVISLLRLSRDKWLLTTIKQITKELDVFNGVNYEAIEFDKYRPLYGRVIISFQKSFQSQGRYLSGIKEQLEINQILPSIFEGDDFEGYDRVKLSFQQLEIIINRGKRDWIAALKNQKAVYLITDLNNGKLYVGSATAQNGMLLSRWSNYIKTGHGGNVELKLLFEDKGFNHFKNHFQFSILENYNAKVDDRLILERESWWKDILQTRKFGYNLN